MVGMVGSSQSQNNITELSKSFTEVSKVSQKYPKYHRSIQNKKHVAEMKIAKNILEAEKKATVGTREEAAP